MRAGYSRLCKLGSLFSTLQVSFYDHQFPSNLEGRTGVKRKEEDLVLEAVPGCKGNTHSSCWSCQRMLAKVDTNEAVLRVRLSPQAC